MRRLLRSLPTCALLACATTGGKAMVQPEEPAVQLAELGENAKQGNLLLVQAWVDSTDYASTWTLSAKLENYLEAAKRQRWLSKKTVVAVAERWPDGLIFSDEEPALYQARTIDDAYKLLGNIHLLDVALRWFTASGEDRTRSSLHQIKAEQVRHSYQKMMSKIAAEYHVTLVGGCLLLPAPRVEAGEIAITVDKPLQRACFVFGPDGQLLEPATLPRQLRADDATLAEPSSAPLAVYNTAAGRLALLVGDDMWDPAQDAALAEAAPDLVLALQDLPVRGAWMKPVVVPACATDVDAAQVQTLSWQQAVQQHGLPARIAAAKAKAGGLVYLAGRAWDRHHDGQLVAFKGEQIELAPHLEAPVLLNLWLGEAPAPPPPAPAVAPAPTPEAAPPPPSKTKSGKKKNKKKGTKR